MTLQPTPQLQLAGENAFILYFAQHISPDVAAAVQLAERQLKSALADQLIELLPSYASLLIVFNPLKHSHLSLRPAILAALTQPLPASAQQSRLVELPVWYSSESGPDLELVAKTKQLSTDDIIRLHSQPLYQVYAIGFAPGFAYLGQLPEQLAMPRLSSPRPKVPAGAVAIADRQTAVYPAASPGGWHLLGLCPVTMFNPAFSSGSAAAMPVAVGDEVRFVPISKAEYQQLKGAS
ncbi:5-oxoprolinase subunit PxpB [Arsukibacterium sp.]|uniref:5-oxoprolinase subunit PxpB n=1 Tax=Arsukibacterium sp. TaxID=1977258 RepID=UPI002FD9CD72